MFIGQRGSLVALVLISASNAQAFIDPFMIVSGLDAVSGIAGGVKALDEATDIGISAGELLGEFELDQTSDEEISDQVKRLEELNRQSRDVRVAGEEGANLFGRDLAKSRSLAQKIRSIREMVKYSKMVASLMGVRPKAGERALKIQDTKLNYLMLDELIEIHRMQFETMLDSKEQRARLSIAMNILPNKTEWGID